MKTLVGLEIHVELNTKTKMFCGCKNEFGAAPNTHVCPVCLGHPGTLPKMNKKALEYAIKAGLALNCTINKETKMDRKKYFYADLVKGFQITQDNKPLCTEGYIEIRTESGVKKVRIQRIHIEEDTGKSIHTDDGHTLMDYNRSGVPLIEIVTYPDVQSSQEAYEFLTSLREILRYIEVSDVKMEEGSLRCDVNINIVDKENDKKTGIAEIKNMNSFKAVTKAIEFEEKRQLHLLEEGVFEGKQTRRWDDSKGETILMRMKDDSTDYRYSAEGDLPDLILKYEFIEEIRKTLPELPHQKKERFIKDYNLVEYDADILSRNSVISRFFEDTVKLESDSNMVANWVISIVLRQINENEILPEDMTLKPEQLARIITLVKENKINANTGKKLLKEIFSDGGDVDSIVKERGLIQISDENALEEIVDGVLKDNEQSIIDYKNGKDRALKYLMGQCMKLSKGKGNPNIFSQMLVEKLDKIEL